MRRSSPASHDRYVGAAPQQQRMDYFGGQDTQEVPDFTPDEETTMLSAEEELQDMHMLFSINPHRGCHSFPPDCLTIVRLQKGNNMCVDCQGYDDMSGIQVEPMYASITHGTLLCRECAAGHVQRDERVSGFSLCFETSDRPLIWSIDTFLVVAWGCIVRASWWFDSNTLLPLLVRTITTYHRL
jgi:hypothetical protein